jgi:transposase
MPAREAGAFVALELPSQAPEVAGDIGIELRRGPISVKITWPVSAARQCAAWMRELLG